MPESCFKNLRGCSRAFDFLSKVIGGAMLLELQTNPCTLLFVLRLQQDIGRTRTDLLKLCSHFCISRDSEVVSAEEPRAVVKNFHRSRRTTSVPSEEQQISASWKEHQNSYPRPYSKTPAPSASITASCPSFVPPEGELEDADGCCF